PRPPPRPPLLPYTPLFRSYFSSLDELIAAAVEYESRRELDAGRERLAELGPQQLSTEEAIELMLDLLLGQESRQRGVEAVLLRYERLVGSPRRPYLAPLMRKLSAELHELLAEIFTRTGLSVDRERLDQLVALVDGAVVNALVESKPDPRAAARRMLRAQLV